MGSIQEENHATSSPPQTICTDFLIIGAGPAGASLACFLAQHKLKGIMLSSARGPADTPRAHVCNSAAPECIRDLDHTLYDECVRLGNSGSRLENVRWTETLLGKEYGRIKSWGSGRKTEYENVSPCVYMDLPQSLMEPLLLSRAAERGWVVRFETELASFVVEEGAGSGKEVQENKKIVALVVDHASGLEYRIRTKYLVGADGGRSTVAKQLDLPFTKLPGGGLAWNVWVRADLNGRMDNREGNLHYAMRFEKDYPFACVMRMVKPYNEWMFVFYPKGPDAPVPEKKHRGVEGDRA